MFDVMKSVGTLYRVDGVVWGALNCCCEPFLNCWFFRFVGYRFFVNLYENIPNKLF